jgi:hypothetical protein
MPITTPAGETFDARRKRDELKLGLIKVLHEHGAPLLIGTDAPIVGPGYAVHDELRLFVQAGLSPYQALRCATTEPARFLGIDHEAGTVAAGMRADVLLLDRNPLVDITATRQISAVFVNSYRFDRSTLDSLLATRAGQLATELPSPSLPAAPAGTSCLRSGSLVERRYGEPVSVLFYAHYEAPDGNRVVDEAARSHTRDRTARVELRPDGVIVQATITSRTALATETIDVLGGEAAQVRTTDYDGLRTQTSIQGRYPSDVLALTAPVLLLPGVVAALAAGQEEVEQHRLEVSAEAGRVHVDVQRLRDSDGSLDYDLADDGRIRSITQRTLSVAMPTEAVWADEGM